MGATFLEVDYQEDGSGSGGYAKEMSDEVSFRVASSVCNSLLDRLFSFFTIRSNLVVQSCPS